MPYRVATFACAAVVIASATVFAHGGKNMPQPFMERHAVMGSLAAHMKAAKAAISSGDLKLAAGQADAIYWLARIMPATFPKGSGPEMGKTRASPKIWEDWAGFEAATNTLAERAKALKTAVDSGDAAAADAAFKTLGREGCSGCHKAYRAPKK
jgi:cytochrome c556